jgi:CheY-like chemotaxis protein
MSTVPTVYPPLLYVDDDANSREIVKLLIVKVMKIPDITIFEESHDFMEKVRALPAVPAVVFLDIQMRPHDGFAMLKMLRSDTTYDKTRIVAMTANVMATDVEALKAAGFNGLIGKPIVRQVFPDLLRQILAGQAVWFIS